MKLKISCHITSFVACVRSKLTTCSKHKVLNVVVLNFFLLYSVLNVALYIQLIYNSHSSYLQIFTFYITDRIDL